MKYKVGAEISIKDMKPDIIYVQKFDDYFMCKGKVKKEKCFAQLVQVIGEVKDIKVTQEDLLQQGVDRVKNSVIASNKIGYRRFLRMLDQQPQKLPPIIKSEQDTIEVIYL